MKTLIRTCLLLLAAVAVMPVHARERRRVRERPVLVRAVAFDGNTVFNRRELLNLMVTRPSRLLNRVPFRQPALDDDVRVLQSFYRNQGFLAATVAAQPVTVDSARRRAGVFIDIAEGPRTFVSGVAVDCPDSLLAAEARGLVQTSAGDPLISTQIDRESRDILELLTGRGYLNAKVSPVTEIEADGREAALVFHIVTGSPVRAGAVTVSGNEKVRERVVRRELTFKQGELLTTTGMRESSRRLFRTGLFEQAAVSPVFRSQSADTADVTVAVTEADLFELEAGIGYGTYELARGSAGIFYKNLFGLGKKAGGRLKASFRIQQGEAVYTDQRFLGLPVHFDANAYYGHHDEKAYDALIGGFRLSAGAAIANVAPYSLSLRWEDVDYLEAVVDTVDSIEAKRTLSLTASMALDTRNDLFNPSKGMYAGVQAEIGGLGNPRYNQFLKLIGDIRGYLPVGRSANLSSGIRAGYARPYGNSSTVPVQERFYAGGSNSIRGYWDRMVGPLVREVQDGDTVPVPEGGDFLLEVHLFEFRFPVYRMIGGALFIDAGNVWRSVNQVRLRDLRWGAGAGIRVNIPFGVIRFDAGMRLNDNPAYAEEPFGAVHLDIGQAF